MDIEKELGKKVLKIYKRTIFGKLSKIEIDLIVFGILVKQKFYNDKTLTKEGGFNWFRINNKHIRQLSFELQLTESRIASLLEQSYLLDFQNEAVDEVILEEMRVLMTQFKQDKNDILAGKLKMYIPNNIAKTAIEAFLAKNGSIPDTSFNKKILTIQLTDLIACFKTDKLLEALKQAAKDANEESKLKDVKNILAKANEKSFSEKLQAIATGTTTIFLGRSGEFMVDEMFKLFKSVVDSH